MSSLCPLTVQTVRHRQRRPSYLSNQRGDFSLFDAVVSLKAGFTHLYQGVMEATQEGSVAVPAVVLEVMCTCVHTPVTFFFPTTVRLFQKYVAVICYLFLLPPLEVFSLCMPQCPFGGCLFSLLFPCSILSLNCPQLC